MISALIPGDCSEVIYHAGNTACQVAREVFDETS
jgi:hypothetical protein